VGCGRVEGGLGLYRDGSVPRVMLTGTGVGGDSAAAMANVARAQGLPDDCLVLEERSRTTRENLLFAGPIVKAHGWHRLALVTSTSHMGRAQRVARLALPDVEWILVPVPDVGPAGRNSPPRLRGLAQRPGAHLRR